MKIICQIKDYYDFLQGQFGIDELVVYDRRNCTVIDSSKFYHFDYPSGYDVYFCRKPFISDTHMVKKNIWQSCKYENNILNRRWSWKKNDKYVNEGNIYHLYLEIGYHAFIFEIERYLDEEDKLVLKPSIVDEKEIKKEDKKSEAPLYISECSLKYYGKKIINGVDNPILKNTWIPSLIPPQDMWNMIYEYISSLRDKEIVDTRTNEQHIESHGFDKKTSFRHRKNVNKN